MGDGMAAAFGSASAAVRAAVAAQRSLAAEPWPTATPLRVRMGVHTGEAERRDGDYFGTVVNRAARLMAVGHGGQVLCSAATAELVGDAAYRVWSIWASTACGTWTGPCTCSRWARAASPALASLDDVPGNLPVQATSFVGREAEVAELAALVGAHRLVTLTGVGGVGKTRLAVQVAAELAGAVPRRGVAGGAGPGGRPRRGGRRGGHRLGGDPPGRVQRGRQRGGGVGGTATCWWWWTTASTCWTPRPSWWRGSWPAPRR